MALSTTTASVSGTGVAVHNPSGGVIDTDESSFTIITSTFTNSAAHTGGVMSIIESSFSITDSTFSTSSAYGSGVMRVYNVSSFNITWSNSNFTSNNVAQGGSGVMFTLNSTFNIVNTTLTNISAHCRAGALNTLNSSFSFTITLLQATVRYN